MTRCSLRRLLFLTVFLLVLIWLGYFGINRTVATRQKPMIQYKLEQEIKKYVGKSLDPQNGMYVSLIDY